MALLTIGDQFPAYRLTALIGGDLSKVDAQQPEDYFTTISSGDFEGKWRVVFFWPKDFTFVCPDRNCRLRQAERRVHRPRHAGARRLGG